MGESKLKRAKHEEMLMSCAGVETAGGRVQVRWESDSAATPMGQLAYFIEFLTVIGLSSRWQESSPLTLMGHKSAKMTKLYFDERDGWFRPQIAKRFSVDFLFAFCRTTLLSG